MTPTEVYISLHSEWFLKSNSEPTPGCIVTKFDTEINDIFWTIALVKKIENICLRVVVNYESGSNPVVFLVSKTATESPYDLLMIELDSSNGNIIKTNKIHSGAEQYSIEKNSN